MGITEDFRHITGHEPAEEDLKRYQDYLEEIVENRTAELIAVNQQLQQQIKEREQSEEALRESEKRFRGLFENSMGGIFTVDLKGNYTSCNPAALKALEASLEEVIGENYRKHIAAESLEMVSQEYNRLFKTGAPIRNISYDIITKRGKRRTIESTVNLLKKGDRVIGFQGTAIDISERKRAEQTLKVSNKFLQVANRHVEMLPLLNEFLSEIRNFTGCESSGIYILDSQDKISDRVQIGPAGDDHEGAGSPILLDKSIWKEIFADIPAEKLPFYSEGGSFCKNSNADLPAITSENQAANSVVEMCLGTESLAVIPVRVESRLLGFIYLADSRQDLMPLENVKLLEAAAMQLGTAVLRIKMNETVRKALQISRQRAAETSALLESSRAVLECQSFEEAARTIFHSCKSSVGATSGYIALIGNDETEYEVVLFDSGEHPCAVSPESAIPVNGLRLATCSLKEPIYRNELRAPECAGFLPTGQMKVKNFLLAPLLLGGKTEGVIGLADKPGGFSEEDARLIAAFAGQAAIALRNNRHLEALHKSEARYRWLSHGLETIVRKKIEELQQAQRLAAIGQMVSVVAHEVRNPLQNISMGLERVREEIGHGSDEMMEVVEEMQFGVDMLNAIVKDLLDYSKPVNLNCSWKSVYDIVANALKSLSDRLLNIKVHEELADRERKIYVDADKMSRVLVNLISNSIDALGDRGELRISSQLWESRGAIWLKLCVADNGCGINEEDLYRIQEPFVTTKEHGTGLGLFICRKIVEAHSGSFNIMSEPNVGTTVEIMLPLWNS